MFDLGTQWSALQNALFALEDFEGGLFALSAVLILWMVVHDWVSLTPRRHH
jgi:hypothetical protein